MGPIKEQHSSFGVVYVSSSWGAPGGVSVDVRNLLEGMRERGYDTVVASTLSSLRRALGHGVSLVHVFGCLPSAAIFGSIALGRATGRRVVWTPIFHPSRPYTWAGYGPLRIMEAFDRVAPQAGRLVHAVVAATPAEAELFRRMGTRSEVIPPAVAAEAPCVDKGAIRTFRSQLGTEEAPLILVVARANSRKGLPFGVATLRELRRRRPDARMLVVGAADGLREDHVAGLHVTGWLDPAEIEIAYLAADLLFVPSRYEQLPRVVIEAWRCGLGVVATDRVALAPAIQAVGGAVVPYGDVCAAALALGNALADPKRTRAAAERGRELVRTEFQLPSVLTRTEALYQEVMSA